MTKQPRTAPQAFTAILNELREVEARTSVRNLSGVFEYQPDVLRKALAYLRRNPDCVMVANGGRVANCYVNAEATLVEVRFLAAEGRFEYTVRRTYAKHRKGGGDGPEAHLVSLSGPRHGFTYNGSQWVKSVWTL